MRAAGATRLTLVYFLRGGQTWDTDQGTVLHAWFRASTSQFLAERLDLQIYSVPKRLKKPISAALDAGGLWQVASWISSANGAENVWRASDHSIAATWEEGNLRITKLDGLAARPW